MKVNTLISAKKASSNTGWFTDLIFSYPIHTKSHPESPERLNLLVKDFNNNVFLRNNVLLFPIRAVTNEELALIHTRKHINGIKNMYGVKIEQLARAAVGGILNACDLIIHKKIITAFVASRPPGHHAINYGREEGFCFYNNISIATKYLQKNGFKKILIIDWDYHHGDGTEFFFYEDPSVLFFSTHDWRAYPGTGDPDKKGKNKGKGFNINVHLNCGSGNDDIEKAFIEQLIPSAEEFKPDFVLISAGFDSRDKDTLGCFKVDDLGFRKLTKIVSKIANTHAGGKIISILEGGYNPTGVSSSAIAHIEELFSNTIK